MDKFCEIKRILQNKLYDPFTMDRLTQFLEDNKIPSLETGEFIYSIRKYKYIDHNRNSKDWKFESEDQSIQITATESGLIGSESFFDQPHAPFITFDKVQMCVENQKKPRKKRKS